MATVSSLASASQYGLLQSQAAQARRDADQADQIAQALRSQANEAQRTADKARSDAQALTGRAQVAGTQQVAANSGENIVKLSQAGHQLIDQQTKTVSANTDSSPTNAAVVLNGLNQITGGLISIRV